MGVWTYVTSHDDGGFFASNNPCGVIDYTSNIRHGRTRVRKRTKTRDDDTRPTSAPSTWSFSSKIGSGRIRKRFELVCYSRVRRALFRISGDVYGRPSRLAAHVVALYAFDKSARWGQIHFETNSKRYAIRETSASRFHCTTGKRRFPERPRTFNVQRETANIVSRAIPSPRVSDNKLPFSCEIFENAFSRRNKNANIHLSRVTQSR